MWCVISNSAASTSLHFNEDSFLVFDVSHETDQHHHHMEQAQKDLPRSKVFVNNKRLVNKDDLLNAQKQFLFSQQESNIVTYCCTQSIFVPILLWFLSNQLFLAECPGYNPVCVRISRDYVEINKVMGVYQMPNENHVDPKLLYRVQLFLSCVISDGTVLGSFNYYYCGQNNHYKKALVL